MIKADIISNYVEKAVHIALRLFMIPLYFNSLGASAYGLIGFYVTLTSMMVLLDFGMGYGAMKILAESRDENREEMVRVLKSVEAVYLLISLLIGVVTALSAKWIAHGWLTIDDPKIDGTNSILLMAILLAVSWPQSLYQSFLSGQKKFVRMNILLIAINILMNTGMFYFIYYRKQGIEYYFIITIVAMLLQTVGLRVMAWRNLPDIRKYAMPGELKSFFSYASGVTVFSLSSLVVFQAPAFYISSFLNTSDLGLFNVAMTFPMAMLTLLYPITSASFPRLVKIDENEAARDSFAMSSSLLGIISAAFFIMLTVNMTGIYSIWLRGNPEIETIARISQILLAGVFMYACQMILATIFLANGNSKLLAWCYLFAIAVLLVSIRLLGSRGLVGVAYVWLLTNIALALALAGAFYMSYRKLFPLWTKIMGSNILLSLTVAAVFIVFLKIASVHGPYAKLMLSGGITTMIFAVPVRKTLKRIH